MEEAEKRGCDTPTESMIADAINDAVHDAYVQCAGWLKSAQHGHAAMLIDRRVKQMHAESWADAGPDDDDDGDDYSPVKPGHDEDGCPTV